MAHHNYCPQNTHLSNSNWKIRQQAKQSHGTAIYTKQECPLILWNPNYEAHRYFDVIDIQNVFNDSGMKNSFIAILSEGLREFELFPPLLHLKK